MSYDSQLSLYVSYSFGLWRKTIITKIYDWLFYMQLTKISTWTMFTTTVKILIFFDVLTPHTYDSMTYELRPWLYDLSLYHDLASCLYHPLALWFLAVLFHYYDYEKMILVIFTAFPCPYTRLISFFFHCPIYDCILVYLGWLMSCKRCIFIFFLLSGRWYYVWATEDDMRRLAELVNIRLFVGWIDLYDSVGLEALFIYKFAGSLLIYIYI